MFLLTLLLVVTTTGRCVGVIFPAAELNFISALVAGNQCELSWQTAMDPGVVSFDLDRLQSGNSGWMKVNATPVVAANSMAGGAYGVFDPGAQPGQTYDYRLVQTDQNGNTTMLGPFLLTPVPSAGVVTPQALGKVGLMTPVTLAQIPHAQPWGMPAPVMLDGMTFVKITTTNSGWQYLPATDLASLLGQPLATIENSLAQGQFQLTTSGQPVTWMAAADDSQLLFYAEGHRDNYSTNNIYWLTSQSNGAPGVENGQAPAPTSSSLWYPASQFYEANVIYASSLPLGAEDDPWMWQQLVSGIPGFNTVNDFAVVDHLTQGADRPAQLSLQLFGGVATTHIIQITINTTNVLGQWTWSGLTPTNLTVMVPSADLGNGSNEITLVAEANGTSLRSQWYLNNFTLSWPRAYTAVNGLVDFTANGNAVVTVAGFGGTNITLLDVTQPKQPLVVTNVTVDQAAGSYRVSFVPASATAHYVAYTPGAGAPEAVLALGQVAGFGASSNAADYVIVAPESLLTSATNLANYRQQTGLKTLIAPLDEVDNEFAFGFPTPHAIQSLLATAWTNWSTPPHYLVLLGKGTYDFLNVLNQSNNLTPPLMVSTPYGIFASDSLMGDVNGDGLPEVAVGRLTGLTTNDINGLVSKIQAYERSSPPFTPQGLLIADLPDSAGDFQSDIEQTDAVLTNKFMDTLLFSTNASVATGLHEQILANWNAGVDLVNYAGHGAIAQLGTAGYLTSADVTNSLTACSRLPVVTAMTCVAGQFAQPSGNCLGETLLQPASGGGIAFYGPTGLSLSGEASELNVRLTTYLRANAMLGLGDMIRQAVADHVSQDLPTVPVWIYNLQGDPALHYNIGRNLLPLQITTITPGTISWSGGLPPYQVEMSASLSGGFWQPVGGTLVGTQTTVTNAGAMGFFRLRGSQ